MKKLRVPLLNANEDQLLVAAVHVEEGEQVQAGQLLFGLESTKAVTDVEAPCAGFVRNLAVAEDDRVEVGFVLCVLTETADEAIPAEATAASGGSSVKATRKARELAETHGVDLQSLSVSGIIKEKDVLAAVGGVAASNREWKDPVEGPNGLVVWGAGGHAKVLLDILRAGHPDLTAIGLVDDAPSGPSEVLGTPVIGKSDRLAGLRDSGVARAALGVGAVTKNSLRVELYERLVELRFQLPNLIHPRAMVEPSATMGQGNQIFAGAVVGSSAVLGDNVIVNSGVVVSHDCRIGSHTHLTPGAILAGSVTIGENCVIGMGVTIYLGVRIGRDVTISNGVHVLHHVPDGTVLRAASKDA